MKTQTRFLILLACVLGLAMAVNVGSAFAHGNGNSIEEFPGAANNKADVLDPIDPLFFNGALDKANPNAIDGIVRGFTVHSPMCTDHYFEDGHTPPNG